MFFTVLQNNKKIKKILYISNNKIIVENLKIGFYFLVQNKVFYVGMEHSKSSSENKIILSKNRINPNLKACGIKKVYLFCDNYGINYVINKKLKRNFVKCSKIILK
jgi:hypothetical protein